MCCIDCVFASRAFVDADDAEDFGFFHASGDAIGDDDLMGIVLSGSSASGSKALKRARAEEKERLKLEKQRLKEEQRDQKRHLKEAEKRRREQEREERLRIERAEREAAERVQDRRALHLRQYRGHAAFQEARPLL